MLVVKITKIQASNATLELTYFRTLTSYVEVVDLAEIHAIFIPIQFGAVTRSTWFSRMTV